MTNPRNRPKPGAYVVIRVVGWVPGLPADLDGKWFDLADIHTDYRPNRPGLVAYETSRFEEREDGALAQVWEIRP